MLRVVYRSRASIARRRPLSTNPAPVSASSPVCAAVFDSAPRLKAVLRDPVSEAGSRASRRLRAGGEVPGVLYGPDGEGNHIRTFIKTDFKTIRKEALKRGPSMPATLYVLEVEGLGEHVVIPDVRLHPVREDPIACNFLKYSKAKALPIPVRFVNDELSVAMRRGAWVLRINRYINCVCKDGKVPEFIDVDLTGAEVGKQFRLKDLTLPEGVIPAKGTDPDLLLGLVDGKK